MKVLAINSSARKDGNTAILLCQVLGEVHSDAEGLNTMRVLGKNMAFLLKALHKNA